MGLTTGRRPVPLGVTNYVWVRTPTGLEMKEVGILNPKDPYTIKSLPEIPFEKVVEGGILSNHTLSKGCKERFCQEVIAPNLHKYPTYYFYADFCSFDCEMWHEELCKKKNL